MRARISHSPRLCARKSNKLPPLCGSSRSRRLSRQPSRLRSQALVPPQSLQPRLVHYQQQRQSLSSRELRQMQPALLAVRNRVLLRRPRFSRLQRQRRRQVRAEPAAQLRTHRQKQLPLPSNLFRQRLKQTQMARRTAWRCQRQRRLLSLSKSHRLVDRLRRCLPPQPLEAQAAPCRQLRQL